MVNCFNMPKESINEIKKKTYVSFKFIETIKYTILIKGTQWCIFKYSYLKQQHSKKGQKSQRFYEMKKYLKLNFGVAPCYHKVFIEKKHSRKT
jgi:hypothetical protein